MKRFFYFTGVVSLGIVVIGCSKPAGESAKVNATNNSPAINGAVNADNSTQVVIPGIQGAPADVNARPAEKFEKGGGTNPAAAGAAIAAASRPAPDDSTFSSTLTDVARETRTFRKHPQLLKVEKVITPDNQSIKVYLRNGKVVELPGDRIKNLSTALAYEILEAAGLNPRATQSSKAEHSGKKQ